jgi:hypothetical protein
MPVVLQADRTSAAAAAQQRTQWVISAMKPPSPSSANPQRQASPIWTGQRQGVTSITS